MTFIIKKVRQITLRQKEFYFIIKYNLIFIIKSYNLYCNYILIGLTIDDFK